MTADPALEAKPEQTFEFINVHLADVSMLSESRQ